MTRWLLLLALLAPGCALEVASDPEDATEVEDRPVDQIDLSGARSEHAPDPCDTGEVHVVNGVEIWTPVLCRPEEIYKGYPSDVRTRLGEDHILPGDVHRDRPGVSMPMP